MEFILNLLGFRKSKSFKVRSQSILNVFNKTIKDLESVNRQIGRKASKNESDIQKLIDENNSLVEQREKNSNIVSKFKKLLEDE